MNTIFLPVRRVALAVILAVVSVVAVAAPSSADDVQVTAATAGDKPVGQETSVWGTAVGQANRPVWTQVYLSSGWSTSQTGTTSSTGSYALPLTYGVDTVGVYSYRVAVQDSSGLVHYSDVVTLRRIPSITASSAATEPVRTTSSAWGVAAGAENRPVWTEVLVNGRWSVSQRGTTSGTGRYVLPLTYGQNTVGEYTYRVGVQTADGGVYYSNNTTLRRTPVISASTTGTKAVGARTYVWGTVVGGANRPAWSEVLVNGRWSVSQRVTTSGSGSYAIPLTYGQNTVGESTYRVGVRTADGRVYYSNNTTLRRTPVVSASTTGTKAVGARTYVWGTVKGGANRPVWTEALVNGRWSVSQRGTTSGSGSYALPLTYGQNSAGVYTYRVGVRTADGRVYYSGNVTLRRETVHVDSRCYSESKVICIDRTNHKLYWVKNGKVAWSADVRTGRPGLETRLGSFRIYYKNTMHLSSLYEVYMPYSMFFSGGQAVHYSSEFARIGYSGPGGSHGCVNMRDMAKIKSLYAEAPVGTKVVVYS